MLWLQLAEHLNLDLPKTHEIHRAMVEHPDCQNAVAVALLSIHHAEGVFARTPEDVAFMGEHEISSNASARETLDRDSRIRIVAIPSGSTGRA